MSTEWFLKLKEYDSLSKMRNTHLKALKEQDDRLSSLNEKRHEKNLQTEKLKQELISEQQNYFETEKKLKSCEEQATRLRDIGGDENKIQQYLKEATQLEDSLFASLEKTESLQGEIEETKTFLTGIEKTIQEIQAEVNSEKETAQKAIDQLDLRLKLIEEELPSNFQTLLKKTLAKNLAIGPFTRIESGSCFFCRYKISRIEESEVDMQQQLKTCPQCMRIFLPYGS